MLCLQLVFCFCVYSRGVVATLHNLHALLNHIAEFAASDRKAVKYIQASGILAATKCAVRCARCSVLVVVRAARTVDSFCVLFSSWLLFFQRAILGKGHKLVRVHPSCMYMIRALLA